MTVLSLTCTKCGKKKEIKSFYTNKLNDIQQGRDFWCKECVKKYVENEDTLRDYCLKNHRIFSQELWDDCANKIRKKYENDVKYNSLSEKDRTVFFNRKTLANYFSRQNQIQYYSYIPQDGSYNQPTNLIEKKQEDISYSQDKKHSVKWGGEFTDEELDYLNEKLKKFQEDYKLKTQNDIDYAMDASMAGLIVRRARNDYLNGVAGSDKRWKDAEAVYDSICTSGKFNQKTRTQNDDSGLGSYGETYKALEESGFYYKPVKFPDDDVDIILKEYSHTQVAVRGDIDNVNA